MTQHHAAVFLDTCSTISCDYMRPKNKFPTWRQNKVLERSDNILVTYAFKPFQHFWNRWRHEYVLILMILSWFLKNVLRHFSRITIVTSVLRCRDSEIRQAIAWIAKTNTILKRFVNKLFPIEDTYQDTN